MRRPYPAFRGFAPASVVLAAALFLLPRGARAAGMAATVRGEVCRPGTYAVGPGDRISTLVEKAGGFTDAAYPRGAALVRKSAAAAQEGELREIVLRIEAATVPLEPSRERDRGERFLAALRGLSAAGRVPVRLSHPRLMKGRAQDIPLEDGDVLTVPPGGGTVAVVGAVASPGAYPVREGAGYRDYVGTAGGRTADADAKRAWLLEADGRATPLARPVVAWDPGRGRWEFTAFAGDAAAPRAGDTIVVPRKAARPGLDELAVRIAVITGSVVLP